MTPILNSDCSDAEHASAVALVSHAQQFEDLMLWRALGSVREGFYIDIGASDPCVYSVSLLFHEHGWHGVHVEPSPKQAEALRLARPGDKVIEAAVGDKRCEEAVYYETEDDAYKGLSTLDNAAKSIINDRGISMRQLSVKIITLDDVFDACESPVVHWLKIDAEGFEGKIIHGWHSNSRPWIVVIESITPLENKPNYDVWELHLKGLGYEFVWTDRVNRFYVHREHSELAEYFVYSPNVLDGFSIDGNSGFGMPLEYRRLYELGLKMIEIEDLSARLNSTQEYVDSLLRSKSWRVTRPLRFITDMARRLRSPNAKEQPIAGGHDAARKLGGTRPLIIRLKDRLCVSFPSPMRVLKNNATIHKLYHRIAYGRRPYASNPIARRALDKSKEMHQYSDSDAKVCADSIYTRLKSQRAESSVLAGENAPRLFVDISELNRTDAGSGIQRVTKNILHNLLTLVPKECVVVPVYHRLGQPVFRVATAFCHKHFGWNFSFVGDDPAIVPRKGDIFLGLDPNWFDLDGYKRIVTEMRDKGVRVEFVVYDLLPLLMPQFFDQQLAPLFAGWLGLVVMGNGAICISKTTAKDLADWVDKNAPQRRNDFKIRYSHIGADFLTQGKSGDLSREAQTMLYTINERPSFLMVCTLEPRKGHAQVLSAFNILWRSGFDVNLVLVGKQGWIVDELVHSIRCHPEMNKRLFWLQGIDDVFLDRLYTECGCLIGASEGEGFGLFLVEAAQRKTPIIARDIPVFREIAGEYAYYFNGKSPEALADAIRSWHDLRKKGQHPRSDDMPWLTWRQSAARFVSLIFEEGYEF